MNNRRNFLKKTALATAGLALTSFKNTAENAENKVEIKTLQKPIVLSTWRFGIEANTAAWEILSKNGRALDAVEAGVKIPEGDPNERSVGYGGRPDRDGKVTLDACIMDEFSNIGSVACLEHIKHPISVARAVMEKTPHVMLVGEGAQQFAIEQGFKLESGELSKDAKNSYNNWLKKSEYKPVINIERKNAISQLDANKMAPYRLSNGEWNHDTIGMIALDIHGNLSGSCTTSGAGFKMRGRVGDSPVIGAGLYVDNEVGAVVATGQGEDVIRVAGASAVVEQMRQGKSPTEACKIIVERINRIKKEKAKDIQICFIAVNKNGDFGSYSLHKGFNFAVHTNEGNKLHESKSLD